jgi:hypothetical protein
LTKASDEIVGASNDSSRRLVPTVAATVRSAAVLRPAGVEAPAKHRICVFVDQVVVEHKSWPSIPPSPSAAEGVKFGEPKLSPTIVIVVPPEGGRF